MWLMHFMSSMLHRSARTIRMLVVISGQLLDVSFFLPGPTYLYLHVQKFLSVTCTVLIIIHSGRSWAREVTLA